MIIYGAVFRCLTPVCLMAAAAESQSPFMRPFGKEAESDDARFAFAVKGSDHFSIYKAYKQWQDAVKNRNAHSFCRRNFIDGQRMEQIHATCVELANLVKNTLGFKGEGEGAINLEHNSNSEGIIKLALCAGLVPRIALVEIDGTVRYGKNLKKKVVVHPSSCNSRKRTRGMSMKSPQFLLYQEVSKSAGGVVHIRETTVVAPIAVLLFSANFEVSFEGGSVSIVLDHGHRVAVPSARIAMIVRVFREKILSLLESKVEDRSDNSIYESPVLRSLEELVNKLQPTAAQKK